MKGHVEIGYLTKFGAVKLNRDQVMIETWLKIHTNVCNFVTASLKTIYRFDLGRSTETLFAGYPGFC